MSTSRVEAHPHDTSQVLAPQAGHHDDIGYRTRKELGPKHEFESPRISDDSFPAYHPCGNHDAAFDLEVRLHLDQCDHGNRHNTATNLEAHSQMDHYNHANHDTSMDQHDHSACSDGAEPSRASSRSHLTSSTTQHLYELRSSLARESLSRARQEQLNARLQEEYDTLLKKLAEAELHIDRMRLAGGTEAGMEDGGAMTVVRGSGEGGRGREGMGREGRGGEGRGKVHTCGYTCMY